MTPVVRWTAVIFAALIIAAPLRAESPSAQQLPYIEVSGRGIIQATPDVATVTLTFSQLDQQASAAKRLVDAQVAELLQLCQKLQIEQRDIQAARLTLYPEYDYSNHKEHPGSRKLIGYRVNRDVEIKLRDLLDYPRLLEGAIGIGASHSGQLQLDFSNRKALEDKALQAAFGDAKAQAELLAQSAGGQLGRPLWIHASSAHSPGPIRMAVMAEMKADSSYPTGEMEVSRQLQVRFALKDS